MNVNQERGHSKKPGFKYLYYYTIGGNLLLHKGPGKSYHNDGTAVIFQIC